jgi:hypothetical protein
LVERQHSELRLRTRHHTRPWPARVAVHTRLWAANR